jgi:uracil phosphoribosyltransferase/phosphoserine phosphatase
MLSDFKQHTEASNMSAVDIAVEAALGSQMGLEKVLLFDADKILTAQDTGFMFWKTLSSEDDTELLSKLLTKQGYSYASFRQATLLYEEKSSGVDAICDKVAAEVSMYPEMIALLARVAQDSHARAAVVTCGVHQIWEKVLKRNNLPHVQVIGGGRISDGYVVTGEIKGHVVDKLQEKKLRVLAFGDGPLDIGMLTKADQAYVVVGEESGRSTTMDAALEKAIASGLRARQIILPTTAEPRLNLERLRRYDLNDSSIHVLCKRPGKFIHATDKNARKLLQTPTRDKKNAGHDLRKHHERIGYYLATEFLSEVLGVEEYDIPHVQGKPTDGYRFQDEEKILIVPLMRGGEPMAFGVSKAMKLASFAHAYTYSDIKKGLFRGKKTIVLVDSVINSGGSVGEFMKPLREEFPDVRVVFVAGVVQSNAVVGFGPVANLLASDSNFTLVALRVSANSYVGNGVTDTGDRLFNTTYLVDKKEE